MLPWTRPQADVAFEADAQTLLAAVRTDIANGKTIGKALKGREIWGGSWKRRGQINGLHKIQLAKPDRWLAKCAWCEQRRELGRDIDVEHYRPKADVCTWQGNPPSVSDTPPAQVRRGDGYWWLAFCWENFSLACKTCNQHWKRNLFPVRAPRPAWGEGVELHEQPLLLDPGSDFRTRDHFRWDIWSGIVEGVSDEGRATIITCGLNRTGLVALRLKAALDTTDATKEFRQAWRRGGKRGAAEAREELTALTSDFEEFTSMRRWIVEQELDIPWEQLEARVLLQTST